MGTHHRPSAFQPVAPAPVADGGAASDGPRMAGTAAGLAGAMGAQLAPPLARMQRIVDELLATSRISRQQVNALLGEIDTARRIGLHGQQLARMPERAGRQTPQRVALHTVVEQVLAGRAATFQQHGMDLAQRLRAVDVVVDAVLLAGLIDTAVDCTLEAGRRLLVSLELKTWPRHAVLGFLATDTPQDAPADAVVPGTGWQPPPQPPLQPIAWHLLERYAAAAGVGMERHMVPGGVQLSIEFPRTVPAVETLGSLDGQATDHADTGLDSLFGEPRPSGRPVVLLVTADAALAAEVAPLCDTLGFALVLAADAQHAQRCLHVGTEAGASAAPQLALLDTRGREAQHDGLRFELQRANPPVPSIDIVDDAHALALAAWRGDSRLRIGRGSLDSQLPQLLAMALGRPG